MATATESMHVKAQPREERGKNESRRLRTKGSIPAVLYGANQPVRSLAIDPKQIGRILHSDTGHNTIFDLELDDEKTKAMIVDWQYEPIKGSLLHIDLKRIAMDKVLRVSVPIVLKGEAAGVKQQSGILEQVLREVEVECLPSDIPGHLDVDVSGLVFGQVLRVA
ncbi:MAG TPA: 50S ribosomal protein L25, partial [Terriglobales bacterium]|nr:50S ribosomal protein L25 [Terriglobales bacterium]